MGTPNILNQFLINAFKVDDLFLIITTLLYQYFENNEVLYAFRGNQSIHCQ